MDAKLRIRWSSVKRASLTGVLLGSLFYPVHRAHGQEADTTRKLKSNPPPEYPELGRRLNLKGAVRVRLTVSPDGNVKAVKELGGNPVLLEALVRAVKKWKYEPAAKESTIEVKYEF